MHLNSTPLQDGWRKIWNLFFSIGEKKLKLSTMVGENFGIYSYRMAKNALKLSTIHGWRKFWNLLISIG